MQAASSLCDQIHTHAVEASTRYKRAEVELIDILQQVEQHRVYLKRGHSSLFQYVIKDLGLSESVAFSLIAVARKSREVPELKAQIRSGKLTLSNARRIVPVLTPQNKDEWLEKGITLSNRQLEKEIVKIRPQEATPERASYVTADRVKLELGLSEREMLKLRRVQDLLCQQKKRPVSLEETISVLTSEFLGRHDPVEKAKRHVVKKGSQVSSEGGSQVSSEGGSQVSSEGGSQVKTASVETTQDAADSDPALKGAELVTLPVAESGQRPEKREPIPAAVLHQVNLRDQRRCTHVLNDGSRCNQSRWIEVHHKIFVCNGGTNTLDNLITLCSAHHKLMHI